MLAGDAALISWVYAPAAYGGAAGSYTITASANDPGSRLANYLRSNTYGLFTVSGGIVPPPPPVVPPATVIPNTVTQNSQVLNDTHHYVWNDGVEDQIYAIFDRRRNYEEEEREESSYLPTRNLDRVFDTRERPLVSFSPELRRERGLDAYAL